MARRRGEVFRNGEWFDWPTPDGTWSIRLVWGDVDGLMECIGAEIWRGARPNDTGTSRPTTWVAPPESSGPQPISSLRSLPIGQIIRRQRLEVSRRQRATATALASAVDTDPDAYPDGLLDYVEESADRITRRSAGRPAYADSHYLEVARVYLQAPDHPRKAVVERFHLSDRGASRAIEQAEQLGFLSKAARRGAIRQAGPNYVEEILDGE